MAYTDPTRSRAAAENYRDVESLPFASIVENIGQQAANVLANSTDEFERSIISGLSSTLQHVYSQMSRVPQSQYSDPMARQTLSVLEQVTTVLQANMQNIASMNPGDIQALIETTAEQTQELRNRLQQQTFATAAHPEQIREEKITIARLERQIDNAAPTNPNLPTWQAELASSKTRVQNWESALKSKEDTAGQLSATIQASEALRRAAQETDRHTAELARAYEDRIFEERQQIETLFPGFNSMRSKIEAWSTALNNTAIPVWARVASVGMLVTEQFVKLASAIAAVVQKLYDFGRTYAVPLEQSGALVAQSFIESFQSIFSLGSFSPAEFQKTLAASVSTFGGRFDRDTTTSLTTESIKRGVTQEELLSGIQAGYGTIGRSFAESRANAAGILASFDKIGLSGRAAFAYMKDQVWLLALYGDKFKGAVAESAARFKLMGLDMQMFRNLSESIVQDFGSFIDATAELGATIPGLQLDVATISQKAFMEGPLAVADELQAQLAATGKTFSDLPYFQQVALKQSLKLDEASLAKLMGKTPLEEIPLQSLEEQKEANNWLEKIAAKFGEVISRLGGLASIITPLTALVGLTKDIFVAILAWRAFRAIRSMVPGAPGGPPGAPVPAPGSLRGVGITGGVIGGVFGGISEYSAAKERGAGTGESLAKGAIGAGVTGALTAATGVAGAMGGRALGGAIGGALGTVLGPIGTFVGGSIGMMVGGWLGSKVSSSINNNFGTGATKSSESRESLAEKPAKLALPAATSSTVLKSQESLAEKPAKLAAPAAAAIPSAASTAAGSVFKYQETPYGYRASITDTTKITPMPQPLPTIPDTSKGEKEKKEQDISQKVDFKPMIVAIKDLGDRISNMKFETTVELDGYVLDRQLSVQRHGAASHLG